MIASNDLVACLRDWVVYTNHVGLRQRAADEIERLQHCNVQLKAEVSDSHRDTESWRNEYAKLRASSEPEAARTTEDSSAVRLQEGWRLVAEALGALPGSVTDAWKLRAIAFVGDRPVPPPSEPQAEIATVRVEGGEIIDAVIKAPGLPDGTHDLFCAPVAAQPSSSLRPGLERAIEIVSKVDCFTAQGATESGFGLADHDREILIAYRDHLVDKLDEAIGAHAQPPATTHEIEPYCIPATGERGILDMDENDVKLRVDGNFDSEDAKRVYCERIAAKLRAAPPPNAGMHPNCTDPCGVCDRADVERYRWLRSHIATTVIQRFKRDDHDSRPEHMDELIDAKLRSNPTKCE